ncbi:uncharacterized protein ACBR49_019206 [Aulostomus maculatus]
MSLLLGQTVLLLNGLSGFAGENIGCPSMCPPVSLNVRPNQQQFFKNSTVCLSCEDGGQAADKWTVMQAGQELSQMSLDFESRNGSTCFQVDLSSVYWCQSRSGQQSRHVNITVTGNQVILEIPALPVPTGSNVTLTCKTTAGPIKEADILKGNTTMAETGELTITNVTWSHQGLYKCYIQLVGLSPHGWLAVEDPPPAPPHQGSSSSGASTPVLIALGSLVLLLAGIFVLRRRRTGMSDASSPADVTYTDVTVPQRADGGGKRPEGPDTVYSQLKTPAVGEHRKYMPLPSPVRSARVE